MGDGDALIMKSKSSIHHIIPNQEPHRSTCLCLNFSNKSLLWSTFVESNEITHLTQRFPILYSNFTLQYSVADRRWAWAWGLRASPLSSVSASPASNLSWESPENSAMASLVLVTLLDSGQAGEEVLYRRHSPLPAHSTALVLSKYSALSLRNLSSKSSKCLYWLRYSLLCQGSAGCGGVFHESVSTIASQAVHVLIMGNLSRYCWVSDYCSSAFTIICPEISRPDHSHISNYRLANQSDQVTKY